MPLLRRKSKLFQATDKYSDTNKLARTDRNRPRHFQKLLILGARKEQNNANCLGPSARSLEGRRKWDSRGSPGAFE